MSTILPEEICRFSVPVVKNYRWFAGRKVDDNFLYGELPASDSEGFDYKIHTNCLSTSIYTNQLQCVFGFFKQPGEEGYMELDEILSIADMMYVTDLEVPPKQYTMYNRGNDIPQKFRDMISSMDVNDIIEGEIRTVRASEITSKDTQLFFDAKLYAIFEKEDILKILF